MHLWHKWETVKELKGKATNGATFIRRDRDYKIPVKGTLQQCKICGKQRGFITEKDGTKYSVNPSVIVVS